MKSEKRNILGLHHIAIRAVDFDRSVEFYTKGLGFTVDHQWSLPQFNLKKAAMLRSPDGSSFLEIFDAEADVAAQGRKHQDGEPFVQTALLHLSFSVVDAAAAFQQALAAGAKPSIEPMEIVLGQADKAVKNALVYSPNGEVIEFIETTYLFKPASNTHEI